MHFGVSTRLQRDFYEVCLWNLRTLLLLLFLTFTLVKCTFADKWKQNPSFFYTLSELRRKCNFKTPLGISLQIHECDIAVSFLFVKETMAVHKKAHKTGCLDKIRQYKQVCAEQRRRRRRRPRPSSSNPSYCFRKSLRCFPYRVDPSGIFCSPKS